MLPLPLTQVDAVFVQIMAKLFTDLHGAGPDFLDYRTLVAHRESSKR
jgi:hypothetical protein